MQDTASNCTEHIPACGFTAPPAPPFLATEGGSSEPWRELKIMFTGVQFVFTGFHCCNLYGTAIRGVELLEPEFSSLSVQRLGPPQTGNAAAAC